MYISVFNTFSHFNTKNEIPLKKTDYLKDFNLKNLQKQESKSLSTPVKNLPVNYILQNNFFTSQLKLQESSEKLKNATKSYVETQKLQNVKTAYTSESKLSFSFPTEPLALTKQNHTSVIKENTYYKEMTNTYTQNENYYKITA